MAQNFYFTILAKSTTEVEAMAEAYELAKTAYGASGLDNHSGVEVRICGEKALVAKVYSNGNIGHCKS